MSTTIWITGVAGFTGKHLVSYLKWQKNGLRIIGLDITPEDPSVELDSFHQLNLNKLDSVTKLAEQEPPSCVFHLAALLPPAREIDMWHVNVGGTVNLLMGLYKSVCENPRVICVGSASEYMASPTGLLTEESPCGGETPHGRTKWAQTAVALSLGKELKIPVIVARPFNLVGPRLPRTLVAGELCAQFAKSEANEIQIGNIHSERDFVDVRDAVAAYWALAEKGEAGEIYNVCSGVSTRIEQLISMLCEITGRYPKINIHSTRFRSVDVDRVYGSREKIFRHTGWVPHISLKQSLTDVLKEVRVELYS